MSKNLFISYGNVFFYFSVMRVGAATAAASHCGSGSGSMEMMQLHAAPSSQSASMIEKGILIVHYTKNKH
jgi:hypothetical protein